jgi:hypothetical protein
MSVFKPPGRIPEPPGGIPVTAIEGFLPGLDMLLKLEKK